MARVTISGTGAGRALLDANRAFVQTLARAGLDMRQENRINKAGLRAAAVVARNEMRRRVGVKSGATRQSIRVGGRLASSTRRRGVEVPLRLGPLWFLLEFGRKSGETSGGRRYGSAPPHPFIGVSIDSTVPQQLAAAQTAMSRAFGRIQRAGL